MPSTRIRPITGRHSLLPAINPAPPTVCLTFSPAHWAEIRGSHVPRFQLNGQLRCGLNASGSLIPCKHVGDLQPGHACKHWETCLHPANSGRVERPSNGASTTIHLISPYCPALALNRTEFPEGFSCRHSNPIRYVVSEASYQVHNA